MKGTEAKNNLFAKMMEIFPNAFWETEGKILRIPMSENGDVVEIKLQLTAAKNILGGASKVDPTTSNEMNFEQSPVKSIEPTQQEKDNVQNLLKSLGMV